MLRMQSAISNSVLMVLHNATLPRGEGLNGHELVVIGKGHTHHLLDADNATPGQLLPIVPLASTSSHRTRAFGTVTARIATTYVYPYPLSSLTP